MKKIVFIIILITTILVISGCTYFNTEDPQYAMSKNCINNRITCTNGHANVQVSCVDMGGYCGAACPYVEGERWWPVPGSSCPKTGTPSQQVEQ